MDLKGKTIILTGAARVGKKIAEDFYGEGANLVLSFLNNPSEAEFSDNSNLQSSKVLAVKADLLQEQDVKNLIDSALKKFGRVDGLIHMAANYNRVPWNELSEKKWNESMDVIAKSAFLMGKNAADEIKKNEGEKTFYEKSPSGVIKGKMVFISDWSVLTKPYRDYLPYNAAKSAVISLTKSFAKELAPEILVNCVAPGPILRPKDLSKEEDEEVLSETPLGRWGGAEEIAKAVKYIFNADFLTGQVLTVDGGRSIN